MNFITKRITGVIPNHRDYHAKYFLVTHNIGAGGVNATPSGWGNYPACGMCISHGISQKRWEQQHNRMLRAFGTNLTD